MAVVQAMPRDRIGTWNAAPEESSMAEVLARALAMVLDPLGGDAGDDDDGRPDP